MNVGRGRLAAALLGLIALTASACGGSDAAAEATPAKDITTLRKDLLPADVLGLKVAEEDVGKTIDQAQRSYVDAVSLYSMRTGDLLQATLQVSRFNSKARFKSSSFRNTLLNQLGGSTARAVRVGSETVYVSTATKQQLAVWFRDKYMLVLASREEYATPRALLREALKVRP